MNVKADADRCIASGQCVLIAPAVFDQREEDGVVRILAEAPPADQRAAVRDAVLACPAVALQLVEP
jgi:ferredoxin